MKDRMARNDLRREDEKKRMKSEGSRVDEFVRCDDLPRDMYSPGTWNRLDVLTHSNLESICRQISQLDFAH